MPTRGIVEQLPLEVAEQPSQSQEQAGERPALEIEFAAEDYWQVLIRSAEQAIAVSAKDSGHPALP